jgi:hypothetical protein
MDEIAQNSLVPSLDSNAAEIRRLGTGIVKSKLDAD